MFIDLYNSILYQPLLNVLVWLYNNLPGNDIGLAIVALTLAIRIALAPFFVQSIKSQKRMQNLQPKIEEIKAKFKGDKEKMGPAIMKLYKDEKVNPMSSCLPLLVQFPFLIAVYQVFRTGLSNGSLDLLYPFVDNPGVINSVAFGLIDLGQPNFWLALLAGAAQFVQSKMMLAKNPKKDQPGNKDTNNLANMGAMMGKQMTYVMPVITVVIASSLPGGLALYWFLSTVVSAFQQLVIFRKLHQSVDSPPTTQINN